MTDDEKNQIVAAVLEEVMKAAKSSHVDPTVKPAKDAIDADEFARKLKIRIRDLRGEPRPRGKLAYDLD